MNVIVHGWMKMNSIFAGTTKENEEGITQMNKFKPTNLLDLKIKQPYR